MELEAGISSIHCHPLLDSKVEALLRYRRRSHKITPLPKIPLSVGEMNVDLTGVVKWVVWRISPQFSHYFLTLNIQKTVGERGMGGEGV